MTLSPKVLLQQEIKILEFSLRRTRKSDAIKLIKSKIAALEMKLEAMKK